MKIVDYTDGILSFDLELGTFTLDKTASQRVLEEIIPIIEKDHLTRNFAFDEDRVMEALRLYPGGLNMTSIASKIGLSVDETRNVLKVLRTQRKVDRISGLYFDPRHFRMQIQPVIGSTPEPMPAARPEGLGSRQKAIMDLLEREGRALSTYEICTRLKFNSTEDVTDVMATLRGRGLVRRAGSDGHYATWEAVA